MPRILVVEDNEENRDSLTRRLERRGFAVIAATDGKAGVEKAKAEKPDLILMDMNMPEMDGWEATRQIKADPALANVKVIALTAYAMGGDRERALEAGCTDYHAKPIEFPKLLAQIEQILQGSG
jgi:CheY-like chemotaxis protein